MKSLATYFKTNKQLYMALLTVALFSLIIARSFFSNQMPRTDDGEYHGARIASYYIGFKQGQLPVYWAGNFNYGFGYPVFLFMYPLPYLVGGFLYAAGAGIELSTNLVVIICIFSSGLGVFVLSYLLNHKPWIALASSLMFVTAPYLLLNFFLPGSFGRNYLYIFVTVGLDTA